MVDVVAESGRVVAQVAYNGDLDQWDGYNRTCGSPGHHHGLARLMDGRYVLIQGTQWEGERDIAWVISEEAAIQAILASDNLNLLDKFGLRAKAEASLAREEVYR